MDSGHDDFRDQDIMTSHPNALSGLTPFGPLANLLPAHLQERLRALQRDSLDLFGHPRDYQHAFDRHIDFFEELIAGGINHGRLGRLLDEVGIRRQDGKPLTRGTISSALSRARERATAAPVRNSIAATVPDVLQPAAASGEALPRAAALCSPQQEPSTDRRTLPRAPRIHRRLPDEDADAPAEDEAEPHEMLSANDPTVVRNLRTASLLNKLRNP